MLFMSPDILVSSLTDNGSNASVHSFYVFLIALSFIVYVGFKHFVDIVWSRVANPGWERVNHQAILNISFLQEAIMELYNGN